MISEYERQWRKQVWAIGEETECCGNCKHFVQHYRLEQGHFASPLHFGHCTKPRMKNRKIYDVCEIFERKEREE